MSNADEPIYSGRLLFRIKASSLEEANALLSDVVVVPLLQEPNEDVDLIEADVIVA